MRGKLAARRRPRRAPAGEILGIAGLAGAGVLELPYVLAGQARPARQRRASDCRSARRSGTTYADARPARHPARAVGPADARGSSRSSPSARTSRCRRCGASAGAGDSSAGRGTRPRRAVDATGSASSPPAPRPRSRRSAAATSRRSSSPAAWCAIHRAVLVLCEPTAGVDIGTRVAIYDLIADLAAAGLTVVVSSSDAGDVLALCTRVVVLRDGVVAAELGGDGLTEHALIRAMEGAGQMSINGRGEDRGRAPSATKAATHVRRADRDGSTCLAFDRIGAVYVWIGIIVVFSFWVPDTFPNLATAKQILNANAITALAALVDHDPARGPRVRPVVRARHDALRRRGGALRRQGRRSAGPGAGDRRCSIGLGVGLINATVVVVDADRLVHRDARDRLADRGAHHDGHQRDADHRREARRAGSPRSARRASAASRCRCVYLRGWSRSRSGTSSSTPRPAGACTPPASTRTRRGSPACASTGCASCRSSTSGGLAGATGIVLASMLGSGSPTAGTPYLLPAFAAVVPRRDAAQARALQRRRHDHRRPAARHRRHRPRRWRTRRSGRATCSSASS